MWNSVPEGDIKGKSGLGTLIIILNTHLTAVGSLQTSIQHVPSSELQGQLQSRVRSVAGRKGSVLDSDRSASISPK